VSAALLLDTHAFIWWATQDGRLSERARAAIADPAATVFLSVVTPWEMTIKHALGRLELAESPRSLVYSQIALHGYRALDVRLDHVLAIADLPTHHTDPFDRLLIAQARCDELSLVTGDSGFERYGADVVW
jgi:PIN domain nuclease of toxin-antitoxin system